jgi:hypothetical protein
MLMSILVALTSLFVFIAGMMGANFYNQSKHASKVSRSAYSSFVGYVLGLAPLLHYGLNAIGDSVPLKLVFGTFFIICTLTWTMCAMILKDFKDAKMENTSNYKYITGVLVATLIMSLIFLFLATFAPVGFGGIGMAKKMMPMAGAVAPVMHYAPSVPYAQAMGSSFVPAGVMQAAGSMAQKAMQQAVPAMQQAVPVMQQAMPMVQQAMQSVPVMQQAMPVFNPVRTGFGRRVGAARRFRR